MMSLIIVAAIAAVFALPHIFAYGRDREAVVTNIAPALIETLTGRYTQYRDVHPSDNDKDRSTFGNLAAKRKTAMSETDSNLRMLRKLLIDDFRQKVRFKATQARRNILSFESRCLAQAALKSLLPSNLPS